MKEKPPGFLIGLDYGTPIRAWDSFRRAELAHIEASHTHRYRHGVMNRALPDGTPSPPAWALQAAPDYTEAAAEILGALGRDKED